MAILNFGSINVDTVYRLPHIPAPGETISASARTQGIGGKGLNQSIAIARAGGKVRHFGAVNSIDRWIISEAEKAGVDTGGILVRENEPTGQAVVMLAADGENTIVLSPGANDGFRDDEIDAAVRSMRRGDWLLIQNETNGIDTAVEAARNFGLRVVFAAAPFSAEIVVPQLAKVDLLALNHIEFAQLQDALGPDRGDRLPALLVTKGAAGAEYRNGDVVESVTTYRVDAVDTTGAGDTFLGYFISGVDQGCTVKQSLEMASAASALQVTRPGAVSAIPTYVEVEVFMRVQNA